MIVLYSPEYLPINGSVYTQIILLINGMLSSLSARTLKGGGSLLIVNATYSPDLEFEHLD